MSSATFADMSPVVDRPGLFRRNQPAHHVQGAFRARRQIDARGAARRDPFAPPHEMRAPGEARTERRHEDQSVRLHAAFLQRVDQRNRHRRCRHVPVTVDGKEDAVQRSADAGDRLDDPEVGLMRVYEVDVLDLVGGSREHFVRRLRHADDRALEDLLAVEVPDRRRT
jgi:hypothetical protein